MSLVNKPKLNAAVDEMQAGLTQVLSFPETTITTEPYYAGMGYCGLRVFVGDSDLIESVRSKCEESIRL